MSDLRAGAATRVITPGPEHWPLWLSGFGDRHEPATGVHDDLEVRVLVVGDGTTTVALVVCDLMAMSRDWADAIRGAVAGALAIERGHVLTAVIHTHAAPSTISGTDALGWKVPRGWRADLVAACVDAAVAARDAMQPVELRTARLGLPSALAFNRRGHGGHLTYAVLDLLAVDRDARVATVVGIGVHAVVLGPDNREVSADWVGACRRHVEQRLGGVAVFVQGGQGDIDPHGRAWVGDPEAAFAAVERVGEDFALAAVAAAVVAQPVAASHAAEPTITVHRRVLELDVAGAPLAAINRVERVEAELVEWDLAGVRIVAAPGEAFARLAEEIVATRAPQPTLVVGLAPHWLGYLPVPYEDGYEEGLSYGAAAVEVIASALGTRP